MAAYACLGLGLAVFTVPLSIVAVIIAYVKRAAAPPFFRAHYDWIVRTFWFMVVGCLVGAILVLAIVGWFVLAAVWVWVLYRVIRGAIHLSEGRLP